MESYLFKSGELCWIFVWDRKNKKFTKVCGTIIKNRNDNCIEILASSKVFIRPAEEVNKFYNKGRFLPWPCYKET